MGDATYADRIRIQVSKVCSHQRQASPATVMRVAYTGGRAHFSYPDLALFTRLIISASTHGVGNLLASVSAC